MVAITEVIKDGKVASTNISCYDNPWWARGNVFVGRNGGNYYRLYNIDGCIRNENLGKGLRYEYRKL